MLHEFQVATQASVHTTRRNYRYCMICDMYHHASCIYVPLDKLTNCEAAIAAFEQATGRSLPRPLPPPLPLACAAGRLHGRGGAARRPGRRTCGQDGALLVARRRLAARTHATELSVDRPGLLAK